MLNFGILGINARNLLYIKKFNDKKSIRLANNKTKTKDFLSARGIPFATTYKIIKNRKELFETNLNKLPNKNFVIKPNKGSKGQGIYICEYLGETQKKQKAKKIKYINKFLQKINFLENKLQKLKNFPYYYKINGKLVDDNTLRRYILDNLGGKNSMTSGSDSVIIEEKLKPGEDFKYFCKYGLADIRIIVFNLTPIAGMLRMPTKNSEGKANLAKGGIGFGINIGNGKINTMFWKQTKYKTNFPKEFEIIKNKEIPYREDILFLSSKIQYFVNLGYLALDRVITDEGPKLLEINARAGLELQKITGIKLKKILEKIEDLKISSPEKGVELSKSLFSEDQIEAKKEKILYLSQNGKLMTKNIKHNDLVVKVDTNKSENYVSTEVFKSIKKHGDENIKLNLYDNDISIKNFKYIEDKSLKNNEIILGKSTSSEFLIKPIDKTKNNVTILDITKLKNDEKNKLHYIDDEISRINKQLSLSKILKPKNYLEELDRFISGNGKYNPQFKYNRPDNKVLDTIETELLNIQKDLEKNEYEKKLSKLFKEKINELFFKKKLIHAYKTNNYKDILLYNEKIFGKIDNKLLSQSKDKIFEGKNENKELLGKILDIGYVKSYIEKYLIKKGIEGSKVIITSTNLARMSVTIGKKPKIKINRLVPFQELELESILAHEIETHLIRSVNGSKTGRKIFNEGTGFYLTDEEGLAIYNANKKLPNGYEKLSFYKKFFLVTEAQKYPFNKLADLAKFLYPEKKEERIFNTILRLKKGISDTGIVNQGAIFFKEKIYLDGYDKIKKWIENGGETNNLYKGKIKIDDLDLIN